MKDLEICRKIKNRRLELGLLLSDVAEAVGVNISTVSRWEAGEIANMGRDKISKLANVLKISPAVIMGWDEDIEFKRSNDIEKRFNDFIIELDMRKDDIVLDGHILNKEEKDMLSNMLTNDLAMMKRIISHK